MALEDLQVLVIEDHEFQRRIAVNLLRQLGVKAVLEATNGQEALLRLGAAPGGVDVILVDLKMPGMDGVQFIRTIAQNRLAASIVIVSSLDAAMLSAVEEMARTHNVTMLGTISKPITPQKLRNLLARHEEAPRVPRAELPWRPTAAALTDALAAGELRVHYQPEVEIGTLRVPVVEALVRWDHADRGLLLPETFLDLAEAHGVMRQLNDFVLDRVLTDLAQWKRCNLQVCVSMNMPASVLNVPGMADAIHKRVSRAGIQSNEFAIEVTENSAATDDIVVVENLLRLRLKGFGLALDDYGTGYATMQQLNRLPLTQLKIDRSFVAEAARRPKLRTLLESSLQLAHKLGLASVAEGVETEEEWELLRALGCNVAQGFLIAHPMPAEAFPDWMHIWSRSAE
jgi:EAL domain-containing protein (putative c-di-GMP-specific phosphodiesterase class I)/ActR/RegA family two-component response regulator